MCEDENLGFDIAPGATEGGFYEEGEKCGKCGQRERVCAIPLKKEGKLFTLPVGLQEGKRLQEGEGGGQVGCVDRQ